MATRRSIGSRSMPTGCPVATTHAARSPACVRLNSSRGRTAAPSDGALEGSYVGASAQVAAAFGAGANALLGTNNIMLNPLSITGLRGFNVAAGISSLELRATGDFGYDAPLPQPPR